MTTCDSWWVTDRQEVPSEDELLTSVHGWLQAEQQVGQTGFSGSGHVCVHVAAVLPQVWLAGFGQRVTHLVVLSNQLLPGGQSLATLRTHNEHHEVQTVRLRSPVHAQINYHTFRRDSLRFNTHPLRHHFLKLVIEETFVNASFTGECLEKHNSSSEMNS